MTSIQIWFVDEIQFSICPIELLFLIIQCESIWPIYVCVNNNGAAWTIHPSSFYLWRFSPVCPVHEPTIIWKKKRQKKKAIIYKSTTFSKDKGTLFCRDSISGALIYWVRGTYPVKQSKVTFQKLKKNNLRQTHSAILGYTSICFFLSLGQLRKLEIPSRSQQPSQNSSLNSKGRYYKLS